MSDPEYQRQYQRQWVAKRRQDWIDEHGPCAKCGSNDRLEVDHVDFSQKSMNVSAVWGMSPKNPKRIAELAKCQVLCHPCHLEKTYVMDFPPVPHGVNSRYTKHKCRCPECTDAHRVHNARYRGSLTQTEECPVEARNAGMRAPQEPLPRTQGLP